MAKANKVLVLRTSDRNRKSYYGHFQWPESGPVEAPDWDPTPKCGGGLHGALWGEGDEFLFSWKNNATWQVVEVDSEDIVDLDGKVKFPRGVVVYSGDRKGATEMILAHPEGKGRAVIGATVTAEHEATVGDYGTATTGDFGTATTGREGTAITGCEGTATAGNGGTATAGNGGTATAGNGGTATAGNGGTATVGDCGTATAGDYGTATAEYYGIALAGDYGTATAGYHGTATVGDYGTATTGIYGQASAGIGGKAFAGYDSSIHIQWYDIGAGRNRFATGYIGEDGLEPNTLYQLDDKGNFVPADE